ncbi:esterase/lipase family protein [Silvanigrella aquatica]|uniref:triacylglycerol lipase n=1 Tax=Silvanigrella aquatica TaxID=1915309 RepID=A0A1L4D094_9BACT|nr:lipase [Silvanigrella aquatica]APJ03625.1 hypothetical protein AXG55_06780 [Silvanigrella aquatica]
MFFIKRFITYFAFLLCFLPHIIQAKNSDPVVLVHGFTGWGRNDLNGFYYWGGFNDLQEDLKSQGNVVFTASVGGLSSNYDRAVELYAQIKGTCADYGEAHAKKYGHARFGRCYPKSLYSQWDDTHKLHFVGHSQGGQTIRSLIKLLKEGSAVEINLNYSDMSDLFKGNKNWVTSITTIATPNNGTSLTNIVDAFLPTAQALLTTFSAFVNVQKNPLLDLKLEHWGIAREKKESLKDYFNKIFNSAVWNTKDMSKWDLSPEGAKEFNDSEKTYQDIYYFSMSTHSTFITNPFNSCKLSLLSILDFPSGAIGCFTQRENGKVTIDSKWLANDGIVNTYSMAAPFQSIKKEYHDSAVIGVWNHLGTKEGWNHLDIIGAVPVLGKSYWSVKDIYMQHLELLHSL